MLLMDSLDAFSSDPPSSSLILQFMLVEKLVEAVKTFTQEKRHRFFPETDFIGDVSCYCTEFRAIGLTFQFSKLQEFEEIFKEFSEDRALLTDDKRTGAVQKCNLGDRFLTPQPAEAEESPSTSRSDWVQLMTDQGRTYCWCRRDNTRHWRLPPGVRHQWVGTRSDDGLYYCGVQTRAACFTLPSLD